MPLTEDTITWTGKTVGVTLEAYNDKYSIKAVRKYQKDDKDVLTFDWIYREGWNKDTRKREMSTKLTPCSVYLGEKEKAIEALTAMLKQLGVTLQDVDGDLPPF